MPETKVIFYKDDDGTVPVVEFLNDMPHRPRQKLYVRIQRLKLLGHELRRPEADYLRDDIYELRVRFGHVNYRILYFFSGSTVAILSAGLTKEDIVPPREIDRSMERRLRFIQHPDRHTFESDKE